MEGDIACAPWNQLLQGNPAMSNMLFESAYTPAQTTLAGTLSGFNSRAAGIGTARSRGISAAAAAFATDELSGAPAMSSLDAPLQPADNYDANNFSEVTFGRAAQTDRLISEVNTMSSLGSQLDQGVNTRTGVYHAGRLAADAGNALVAYTERYSDAPPVMQYRRLKVLSTPLEQLGLDGNFGVDDTGRDVQTMDAGLLASAMGLSQSSIDTARALGLSQRQTADLANGF